MDEKMDRSALVDAKRWLLSQLLRIPDWEKTTSDEELEAVLMNDSEVNVYFRSAKEEAEDGTGGMGHGHR